MALAVGQRSNHGTRALGLPVPSNAKHKQSVDLDYDLLVTRVENTIIADRERQTSGITPQELLARSNPAMYSSDTDQNAPARDLTNPREMYNVLSNRTKSIDDLAVKFKQELAKSCNANGPLPNLSRTLSMNDIDQSPIKELRLGHKPSHAGIMHSGEGKLGVLVLNRHKTSVDEFGRSTEENKENIRSFNLPQLTQHARPTQPDGFRDKDQVLLELPALQENDTMPNGDVEYTVNHAAYSKHLLRVRQNLSASDTKLDKWFSEMPNEVFDKAQRALMEESIKEKLSEYQRKRSRKMNFPNKNVHVCVGSKVRTVPNTYLELRVDSFGRHLQNDKDDKLNKYKLQQRSMHNLKMRETWENERPAREETLPRLALQHRSLTTLALTKTKPKNDANKTKKTIIKIPTEHEGRLATVYMNDNFDPIENEQRPRPRHGISNYEEYTERLNMTKEAHDIANARVENTRVENTRVENTRVDAKTERSQLNSPPPNTIIDDYDQTLSGSSFDRDTTKAAIVNISLKKEIPKTRKPIHLEKTMKEAEETERISKRLTDVGKDVGGNVNGTLNNEAGEDDIDGQKQKHDPIITKIPTAQSSRTSESKSSSASLLSNKAALKKFNTLEVFAEHGKPMYGTQKNRREPKLKSLDGLRGLPLPASLRFDIRNPLGPLTNPREYTMNLPFNVAKKQDVMFRFEPGEVFVTRGNPNQIQTHTRSSERARVIYGKILNQGRDLYDKKDKPGKPRDEFRDGNSMMTVSTKLEGFKSEFSRFESRALDSSIRSFSPRQDNGAYNNMFVIGSRNEVMHGTNERHNSLSTMTETPLGMLNENDTMNVRDVATETELKGSQHASGLTNNHQSGQGSVIVRASSGLSDFIIDNNDGESLESDGDTDVAQTTRLRSNHSI